VLVDDLLYSYRHGYAVRDSLREEDFRCRCIVLLWCGDYQGQGKIANMKHSGLFGCHWCMHPFRKRLGTSGSNHADNNRRNMAPDDPLRWDDEYGGDKEDANENVPPHARTHAGICEVGRRLSNFEGTKAERERQQEATGINGFCVLGLLPMFDMAWDILLDWMHVIKNIFEDHLLKLFFAAKPVAQPKHPSHKMNGRDLAGEARRISIAKHEECMRLYREVKRVRASLQITSPLPHDVIRSHRDTCLLCACRMRTHGF
jgi:hypothetical protein